MSEILEGVKVLDFGRYIAGPFCGALLADYGAEVIRIERVNGREDRYVTPVTEDGQGAMFLQLNRNKLGLTLNPTKDKGKEIIKKLVERSDIVIANLPEQTLKFSTTTTTENLWHRTLGKHSSLPWQSSDQTELMRCEIIFAT